MKMYLITRTSSWQEDVNNPPCEEAVLMDHRYVDRRTFTSPDEMRAQTRNEWFSEGANHRVENGQCCRDMLGGRRWFIVIKSLDDLMAFVDKYGEVVLSGDTIEIYDGYRE